jgi:AcrR family transcriptional regulator
MPSNHKREFRQPLGGVARDRMLRAAAGILRRGGYAGLTMERVAAESGAAKTTVYRHWATKAALCMDLYLEVASRELRDPDSGDVEKDLRFICDTVIHVQTRTIAGEAFIGLIAEAQLNRSTRSAFLLFAKRRRGLTRMVLQRAIDRGELRRDLDIDLFIDALGGATTFRLLQKHAPLNPAFSRALVSLLLMGCRTEKER